jgi:hypothetical protein
LWWCPTGPFVFLPIHAAGIFMTERTKDVSDYGISSYTPTISSLLSNIPNPTSNDPFKMMVVIQSSTPGEKPLPCTLDELQKIEAHVPVENLVKLVPGSVESSNCIDRSLCVSWATISKEATRECLTTSRRSTKGLPNHGAIHTERVVSFSQRLRDGDGR